MNKEKKKKNGKRLTRYFSKMVQIILMKNLNSSYDPDPQPLCRKGDLKCTFIIFLCKKGHYKNIARRGN
jgi:hypothetical protein